MAYAILEDWDRSELVKLIEKIELKKSEIPLFLFALDVQLAVMPKPWYLGDTSVIRERIETLLKERFDLAEGNSPP